MTKKHIEIVQSLIPFSPLYTFNHRFQVSNFVLVLLVFVLHLTLKSSWRISDLNSDHLAKKIRWWYIQMLVYISSDISSKCVNSLLRIEFLNKRVGCDSSSIGLDRRSFWQKYFKSVFIYLAYISPSVLYILQLDLSSWIHWWIPLKNLAPSDYVTGFKWHESASVFVRWHRLTEKTEQTNKHTNKQTNEDIKFFRIHPTNKSVSQWVYTHNRARAGTRDLFLSESFFSLFFSGGWGVLLFPWDRKAKWAGGHSHHSILAK